MADSGLDLDSIEQLAGQVGHASPNGIVITNKSGAIVWVNASFEKTFGYTSPDLIGEPIEVLVPDDVKGRHVALRDAFAREPSRRPMGGTVVLFGRHRDGRNIPIEVGLGSLETADQVYSIAFVIDVTPRYRREKELEIYRRNLEQMVDERTEDLRMALRSTESNVKLLQDVLRSFSHEFRTPLSIIVGYAEMMKSMADNNIVDFDRDHEDYPALILDAGNMLIELAAKASQMTVVSTGGAVADTKPLALDEIVERARCRSAKLMRSMVSEFQVNLVDVPMVRGDEDLLIRTMDLLFENAAKYAGADSKLIISAEKRAGRCRLRLDDNGAGLNEGDYQRAFEPFERLGQKHGSVSGTGLGLTLAQAYMTAMGGRMGMEQSPQGGLRVWLELPLA
ncbi:ATP-binding protein [Thalassovita sp.]|uniref:PAS domain-containing sensor histidine kinase n=1 Tax=Thalassovita sp. TaxID=1979401 RepID=UPI002B269032|nr:ATP-binding protein [Thalassovita sp.]